MPAHDRIAIVMPVLDDWMSFSMVIQAIAQRFARTERHFVVVAVDDGSTMHLSDTRALLPHGSCIEAIEVLQLAINLGHQRAIAVGLASIARRDDINTVVVMDSDGQDRDEDIVTLLAAADQHPEHVVLAQRTRRSEGVIFRIGYAIYKMLFRVLVGRTINFGNFCLLPMSVVRRLVHMPDLWNNLPAAIMRSRLPHVAVPTVRGVRHAGQSHMNVPSLVLHGLSALSVYVDQIFVRVLLGTAAAAAITVLGALIVVIVRFSTSFGVPGWASTMIGDLFIILMQTIVIAVATTLMVLGNRSQRPIVPFADAPSFIVHRELMTAEDARHGAAT